MKPNFPFIPYGRQAIDQADIDSVVECLQSDFLTQGPKVPEFEQAVASYCGAEFALALNSATSALHVACLALGLGEGDYLWTTPNTFVASANCGLYCGAKVDFVDINPATYNLCVEKLVEKLAVAKEQGNLPKVLVAVHFAGQSCEMEKIAALAKEYDFKVIEDASHAIGGSFQGKKIGGCQYSDITVFSFHPVKIITTAEGGMITTNSKQLADKIELLRSHGITRQVEKLAETSRNQIWFYEQQTLGFNYRMTDLQAALGISQMQKIDEFVAKRREIAAIYDKSLQKLADSGLLVLPAQAENTASAFHLYPVLLAADIRTQVFEFLRSKNIGVNVHYIPVHTQPFYQALGFKPGDFLNAENYYAKTISLPIHPGLSLEQQEFVVASLEQALGQALEQAGKV